MFSSKKGAVLLYLIMGMTMIASLGLGMFYINTTSTFSQIGANKLNKAHYLAESGMRFALQKLTDNELFNTTTAGTDYTLSSITNGKFNLYVNGVDVVGSEITITSTGVSNPDTPFEARKTITVKVSNTIANNLGEGPFSSGGEGSAGLAALADTALGGGTSGAKGVSVDTVNKHIYLGYDPLTGLGIQNSAGCVWYEGWADSNGSDCKEGRCNFNKGIRAYFDIVYTNWVADGFTFAIISAHDNNPGGVPDYINKVTDCGGGQLGEYMGYAGPGTGTTGHGLQPPKIAVEFDPYTAGTSTNVCSSGSRNDSTFSSPFKHISLVFWGTQDGGSCDNGSGTFISSITYDDNRHGIGSVDGSNPINPQNSDGDGNGFKKIDFGASGSRSFRIEIDRVDDATNLDYRKYKIRAWLKTYNVNGYKDSNNVNFDDTSIKYSDNPTFQKTITLTQPWHDKFDRMIFGFTQATGGSTQNITVDNFKIDFKNSNDF